MKLSPGHRAALLNIVASTMRRRSLAPAVAPSATGVYDIPLSTVSLNSNFDAYINVSLAGAPAGFSVSLLVDSGNSTLVLPRWEDIRSIPGYQGNYTVLGQANEPWGCPANIVRGPIELIGNSTPSPVLENCVFYACTGNSPSDGTRTSNFGVGCLNPWTASAWNTAITGATMQSPLSYCNFPCAEFDYAPAEQVIQGNGANGATDGNSHLRLYQTAPAGYTMFDIVKDSMWMCLVPKGLQIAGTPTQWPGPEAAIAMVDTGGGPVFLSDPDGYVYPKQWPNDVTNPDWAADSVSCQSTQASVGIKLGDANGSYSYVIDDSAFPPAAQGLTLVMCKENEYMMGQRGLNTGGISALANCILIDFPNKRVGLKAK